jgi:hypothetical protein
LLFINDIGKDIPEDVQQTLFADGAAIYYSHISQEKLQEAVTAVEKWSTDNKLDLNLSKSCTFFFSTDPHEATWRPSIILLGEQMKFGEGEEEANPKFLGIRLDRSLCFQDHVADVCSRVTKRCRMLSCLAGRLWGWRKQSLRKVFTATQRSIMDYAAAAWQPWLSATQLRKLETVQNKCLRLITGQYANSDLDAIRLEAGISSYSTHSAQLTAIAYEKGMRLPEQHPRHIALAGDVPHKLQKRSSCREKAKATLSTLSLSNHTRQPISLPIIQPWSTNYRNWHIHTNETIKNDIPAIRDVIDGLNADLVIYTDGSCTSGLYDGGAAADITVGQFDDPQCTEVLEAKGSKLTCSYDEERRALLLGLDWLAKNPHDQVAFCTDSLSLL